MYGERYTESKRPWRAATASRRASLAVVLAAVLLVVAGCGESAPREAQDHVGIRVSGTEGVRYFGSYGPLGDELKRVEDTLGSGPARYEIPVEQRGTDYDIASAAFQKLSAGGRLTVAVLWKGKIVEEETVSDKEDVITLNYQPPSDGTGSTQKSPES